MKKPRSKRISPQVLAERQKSRKLAREARNLAWERKRKLEDENNKQIIIPPRELTERQIAWIEKNSQPKVRRIPRYTPYFSRWAKRGPMTRNDWVKFYKWANNNAEAKQLPAPRPQTEKGKKKRKRPLKITVEKLLDDIEKLATPKMPREKYQYPPPVKYPYSPQINLNEPAKHDRGRPFPLPKVPVDFKHLELEIDFWSQLRFPIRPSALKYKPSENVLSLSQPRITPPLEPHCPIPEKPIEYVEPRRRMNRHQWREHKKRLAYLAQPVQHPVVEVYY